jgi:3',5'-cyclic AMP phosphodiesterase CpdA
MSTPPPTRRQVIITGAALSLPLLTDTSHAIDTPHPILRFAHLTDMHVDSRPRAADGFAAALQHLAKINPAPDFIITGGDHVFDTFASSRHFADQQWDLYAAALRAHTSLPIHPILGNHDIWNWGEADADPSAPGYGKALALDRLGLKQSYYSLDRAGWHFIFLDNVSRRDRSYFGHLDEAQLAWLKDDLQSAGQKPIIVITHIPILSACAFFDVDTRFKENAWHIPDATNHRDPRPLIDLLKTANTRLCISGHIHLLDRVEYRGITFICDGAICGNWWKGPLQETAEGYGLFDLYADGTFHHEYHAYGWNAHP